MLFVAGRGAGGDRDRTGARTGRRCSCLAPDPDAPVVAFEGVTTAFDASSGPRWTVEVTDVLEGDVPGDEVAVMIDAPFEQAGPVVAVSSCSVEAAPELGGTYRFTVAPVTEGPFQVNLCTGAFEEVAGGGAPATPAAEDESDDPPPWGLIVPGVLAVVTLGGLLTLKLMSRVALRSCP